MNIPTKQCRIIQIDDDAAEHTLLQETTRWMRDPFQILCFFTPEDARRYLKSKAAAPSRRNDLPAFVLLDFKLSRTIGPEAIPMLRTIPGCESMPMIIFT